VCLLCRGKGLLALVRNFEPKENKQRENKTYCGPKKGNIREKNTHLSRTWGSSGLSSGFLSARRKKRILLRRDGRLIGATGLEMKQPGERKSTSNKKRSLELPPPPKKIPNQDWAYERKGRRKVMGGGWIDKVSYFPWRDCKPAIIAKKKGNHFLGKKRGGGEGTATIGESNPSTRKKVRLWNGRRKTLKRVNGKSSPRK